MSDKNKNKKSSLKDFFRYQGNEMTGEERNSFEKELQKDPFSEEAAEGFSHISAETAKEDISILQKLLMERSRRRSSIVFYRIAAAVAVLMVASAIFFVTQRKDRVVTLSENTYKENKSPVIGPERDALSKQEGKATEKKEVTPPPSPQKSKKDGRPVISKVADLQVAEPQEAITKDSEVTKPEITLITADEAAAESFATEKRMDMARAAGASANVKSEKISDYIPPQSAVGKDSFDIFLAKNIRNPEPENSIKQVVIIKFKVKVDSTITGIKIISSPGKAWSKEAIRLIKAGPAWKPAEENGKTIEDEVRVRVVFR